MKKLLLIEGLVKASASIFAIKTIFLYLEPWQFVQYTKITILLQLYISIISAPASALFSDLISKESRRDAISPYLSGALLWYLVSFPCVILINIFSLSQFDKPHGMLWIFYIMPLSALASSGSQLIIQYVVGINQVGIAVKCSTILSILGSLFTIIFTICIGFKGLLIAIVFAPIICVIVIAYQIRGNVTLAFGFSGIEYLAKNSYRNLFSICFFGAFTPFINNLIFLVGLNSYSMQMGALNASLAAFSIKLADYASSVVSPGLSNYLVSTSEHEKYSMLEVGRLKLIVTAAISAICLYLALSFFPDRIISLVSSRNYYAAAPLLRLEIIAFFLKFCYWIFLYQFLTRYSAIYFSLLESLLLLISFVSLMVMIQYELLSSFQFSSMLKSLVGIVLITNIIRIPSNSHE